MTDETSGNNTILEPPRQTGDVAVDMAAQAQWNKGLYDALVLNGQFLSTAEQFDTGDFDPDSLPSPSNTNVAQAQQTANEAYQLAAAALVRATANQEIIELFGTVTVSNADTTGSATFSEAQEDATYSLVLTAVSETGTPAAGSATITKQEKTTGGFTITVEVAPGASNSVTFAWHLRRS